MSLLYNHPVAAPMAVVALAALVVVAATEWEALMERRPKRRVPEFMREWSR